MTRTLFLILLFTCTASAPLLAQPDSLSARVQGVHLDAGLIHNRLIDEGLTASNLLFHGTAFKIKAGYWMTAEKFSLGGYLDLGAGNIRTDKDRIESELIAINLYLFYLRKIAEYDVFKRHGKLSAGLELSSQNIVIDGLEVLDNASVLFAQGLNASLLQDIRLSNIRSLQLGLVVPLVAYAKRETYDSGVNDELRNEFDDSAGKFLFNDSRWLFIPGFRLKTVYTKTLTPRMYFVLAYEFRYLNNRQSEPLRIYSNELTAGLKITFK